MMKVSPKISALNQNFKKLRHGYNDVNIITNIFLSLEALVPFCLRKKKPENAFLTLTVNYCRITQKNNLCHPKQH